MAKRISKKKEFLHLVRYGTAGDQKYLLDEFLKTYDMIVLNANMVVHAPAAISAFLFQHSLSKPFIIDPQTFAFGLDLKYLRSKSKSKSKGQIKKPFSKLAEAYGELFQNRLKTGKELSLSDLKISKSDIVKMVCDFQLNYLENQAKEDDVEKYYEFSEEEGDIEFNRTPDFLIPPYFFLDSFNFSDWLDLNVLFVEETILQYADKKITPQIVISKEILNDSNRVQELVSRYTSIKGIHAFLFWIDAHAETELDRTQLDNFINFLKSLGKSHPIINLYGGGYSVLLGRTKVIPNYMGVCHSIEYGESRAVAPVGGGIPVSKFYLPTVFKRFHYRDVISIFQRNAWLKSTTAYFKHVCSCKTCSSVITSDPSDDFALFGKMNTKKERTPDGQEISRQYPAGEAKDLCKRHYMHSKHSEYTDKKFEDLNEVIRSLKTVSKNIPIELSRETAYIAPWISSLENETSK